MATKRRRVTRGRQLLEFPFATYVFRSFAGRGGFTGDPHPRDDDEAREYWPRYRRESWMQTHIGRVPVAAREFDDVTDDAMTAVACQRPIHEVRAALAGDRARLAAFRGRPEARDVGDALELFAATLDAIEHVAAVVGTRTDAKAAALRHGVISSSTYGRHFGVPYRDRPTA